MDVAMEKDERTLFESFVHRCDRYLEFGTGGSTWLAASTKKRWVVSIDSSKDWLERVAVETQSCQTQPDLIFADIGPTKEWGFPKSEETKAKWPVYHELVWSRAGAEQSDLFFVDGRFRVACALQCLIRSQLGAVLGVHDFEDRAHYHVLLEFAREIARSRRLSFFLRRNVFDENRAFLFLDKFRFDPN